MDLFTAADDCLGHRAVEHVYDNFGVPLEHRCLARKVLVLHKECPELAARLHENFFAGHQEVPGVVAGCIYAANKVICDCVAKLEKRKQHRRSPTPTLFEEVISFESLGIVLELDEEELVPVPLKIALVATHPNQLLPILPN